MQALKSGRQWPAACAVAGEVLVTVSAIRTTEASAGTIGPTGRPLPRFPDPKPLFKHGPARVVAVCNQKGGVGKTTTTISLGAALAELGRRVLLVDFDPQGALSVGLGFQPHELDATVYNVLMEAGVTARDVLFPTKVDGMDLLPSNIDLSGAEVQLVHEDTTSSSSTASHHSAC
jgi:chromosome partitioning protein